MNIQDAALRLYTPPFTYHHGYVWDANNNMVADDAGGHNGEVVALRIRGWGRIGYKPNAAELQDKVGELIATAMTEFWERELAVAKMREEAAA